MDYVLYVFIVSLVYSLCSFLPSFFFFVVNFTHSGSWPHGAFDVMCTQTGN